jgi:hypothetical protein
MIGTSKSSKKPTEAYMLRNRFVLVLVCTTLLLLGGTYSYNAQQSPLLEERIRQLEALTKELSDRITEQAKELSDRITEQDGDMAWLSRTSVPVGGLSRSMVRGRPLESI